MKIVFSVFLIVLSYTIIIPSYSQGFTPPKMIIGLSLDGNIAINDAHGSSITNKESYGMIWGRGFSLYSKMGFGIRKNHRITLGASYNKMINHYDKKIPFFVFTPANTTLYTNYNIWTGALGWEYAFNPRCRSKQFIGIAVTANYLTSTVGSYIQFENAIRYGVMFSTGYEFVLDKSYKTGLVIGLKYNLTNILGTSNGIGDLNDGSESSYGPGFYRRIGILSLNIGFNLYTGVKPYILK